MQQGALPPARPPLCWGGAGSSTTWTSYGGRSTRGGGGASLGTDWWDAGGGGAGSCAAFYHNGKGGASLAQSPPVVTPLNFGSTSLVLAPPSAITWHVPSETHDKIHRGEFVNVFDLINAWVVPSRPRTSKESELKPKTVWVEWSLRNWVTKVFHLHSDSN